MNQLRKTNEPSTSQSTYPYGEIRPQLDQADKYANIRGQKVKWERLWQGIWIDRAYFILPEGTKITREEYLGKQEAIKI